MANDEKRRQGNHDHNQTEGDPLLEETRLDLLRIASNRFTLEVHLVEGLVDALLRCVLDTS